MWGGIFAVGFVLTSWGFAFILARAIRTADALDKALDDVAHGDCFPFVPTDADQLDRLRAFEGVHCERGSEHLPSYRSGGVSDVPTVFHAPSTTSEGQRHHG